MARGITESDVHGAADALVASGERPTVERIRSHLGTGSPNTVTRWLETWWRQLGRRLQAQQARLDVPGAPEVVALLAGEWWGRALEAARDEYAQALANERDALLKDREILDNERARLTAEGSALRAELDAARHGERVAQAQGTELQRLIEQLHQQAHELKQQRDVALTRGTELEISREALQQHLQRAEDSARTERESLTQLLRATEDRAHTEIDRARQEAKLLSSKLNALDKERTSVELCHRNQLEEARQASAELQYQVAAQQARAGGLEAQIENLRNLQLTLEAALRTRNRANPKATGKKSKVEAARTRSDGPRT